MAKDERVAKDAEVASAQRTGLSQRLEAVCAAWEEEGQSKEWCWGVCESAFGSLWCWALVAWLAVVRCSCVWEALPAVQGAEAPQVLL